MDLDDSGIEGMVILLGVLALGLMVLPDATFGFLGRVLGFLEFLEAFVVELSDCLLV